MQQACKSGNYTAKQPRTGSPKSSNRLKMTVCSCLAKPVVQQDCGCDLGKNRKRSELPLLFTAFSCPLRGPGRACNISRLTGVKCSLPQHRLQNQLSILSLLKRTVEDQRFSRHGLYFFEG